MCHEALKEYFEKGQFSTSQEDYLLSDVLDNNDVYSILYPDNLPEQMLQNRDSIMHLFLWDLNYYKADEQIQNSSNSECRRAYNIWGQERMLRDIKKCLDEKSNEKLSELIFGIIKHWPFLRDDVFSTDCLDLKECKSTEDYQDFIDQHPNTYPEYILQAKYEIAELSGCAFEELQTALTEYPNSEWVKNLKKRCRTTSLHIPYTFSRKLNDKPKTQTIIEEFFESFVELSIDDNVPDDNKHFYITDCLVSEKLWNAMTGIRHQVLRKNLDVEKMMTREELKGFTLAIQRLTWIRLRPPTKQEWLEYNIYQSKRTEKPISPSESYRSHPACHTWQWCIPSLDKNEGSFVTTSGCTEIYPVPFGCYAACQLVLDV